MSRLRLLERLNRHEHERQRRGRDDREAIKRSVRHHICQILGTREGNVPVDPSFGLGSVPSRADSGESGRADEASADAVRALIGRYEPRVCDISVTTRGLGAKRLGVELDISAVIKDDPQPTRVRLSGTLSMGGLFVTTWS